MFKWVLWAPEPSKGIQIIAKYNLRLHFRSLKTFWETSGRCRPLPDGTADWHFRTLNKEERNPSLIASGNFLMINATPHTFSERYRRSVRLRRTPRGAEPPRRGTSRGGDAPRHRHETSEKLPIPSDSIFFTIGFEFATVWCKDFCVYPKFSSKNSSNFFSNFFHIFSKNF